MSEANEVTPTLETLPTHLYMIRHGQAVVNVTPVLGGMKGDTGLTDTGREQAGRLRDRLLATGEIKADVLLASTLPRAMETATIIAPALGLPIIPDDDLHELRVGPDADGLSLDEYRKRYGWVDLTLEPLRPVDPGGESWAMFQLRVAIALNRIATEHAGKTVVIVAHGGIIDSSFIYFFGMNAHAVPSARFHTSNTSITHWERRMNHGRLQWRLAKYNDDIHLLGLNGTVPYDWTKVIPTPPKTD